jgi:hypothetical protein
VQGLCKIAVTIFFLNLFTVFVLNSWNPLVSPSSRDRDSGFFVKSPTRVRKASEAVVDARTSRKLWLRSATRRTKLLLDKNPAS